MFFIFHEIIFFAKEFLNNSFFLMIDKVVFKKITHILTLHIKNEQSKSIKSS